MGPAAPPVARSTTSVAQVPAYMLQWSGGAGVPGGYPPELPFGGIGLGHRPG